MAVLERRMESLTYPVRVIKKWADDELITRPSNPFGKNLRELSPSGRCDDERVPLGAHA
ncbi:hypothetical protein BJ994_003377 [Arthrobacter pigmenti]|uniref:Uncharacterized protein n=1 Tax=Arthrobacter pigmenti TaxID=271432 RepID=A0A846S1J2_9MICC|nr:hypothetical protein [Arthrobacter pigmenti]NJC24301.1 hypothetical protein [Arthrobacter pigmenti]